MSADAEQEYFADSMVKEIITAVSRFKSGGLPAFSFCFDD